MKHAWLMLGVFLFNKIGGKLNFQNSGIKIYDVSFYQTVMFEYVNGKRILLPVEKQKHIDFNKMKEKANAVIIKAGQRNYSDPAFEISWSNAKKAGLPRGSYWFCDKFDNPRNQARLYWSLMKNDLPEGILAADFENGSWLDLNNLYVFINELQQISGLPNNKIAVYTNYYYFMEASQNAKREWFGNYPLWIASYTRDPKDVRTPPVWKESLIWQYGTPVIGLDSGVQSKEIDANWFNGDLEKFKTFFGNVNVSPVVENDLPIKNKPIEVIAVYNSEKVIYNKEK